MSFEALRADLDSLQKSLTTPAAPVVVAPTAEEAAAALAAAGGGTTEGEGELSKSFSFELADGTTVEAIDGTALVKSLGARLVQAEESAAKTSTEVLAVLTQQTALIKSLSAEITTLRAAPAGRRSVLAVTESIPASNTTATTETDLAKSLTFKTGKDALNAADAAYKAGRISSMDLAKCENFVGRGLQFPADLAVRVAG